MPAKARAERADAFAHIYDLFAGFGPIVVRRMFGGAGVYADGVMFALIADDVVYLKADAKTQPAFEAEGCAPFAYTTKDGRRSVMSYWRMPDRLYDDSDALAEWSREALAVARSIPTARRRKGK